MVCFSIYQGPIFEVYSSEHINLAGALNDPYKPFPMVSFKGIFRFIALFPEQGCGITRSSSNHCDTRSLPLWLWGVSFGKPFSLYHRGGFHFPQPCSVTTVSGRPSRSICRSSRFEKSESYVLGTIISAVMVTTIIVSPLAEATTLEQTNERTNKQTNKQAGKQASKQTHQLTRQLCSLRLFQSITKPQVTSWM